MAKYPFEKEKRIWINGKLVRWEEARIHVLSHVVHYGSGVFEGIRCYPIANEKRSAIFRLVDHLQRFFNSAKVYMMDIPFSLEEIEEACISVVRSNDLRECYIRPIAYRAYTEDEDTWGYMGLNPLNCPVHVAIIAFKFPTYGAPIYRCITSSWRRISSDAFPTTAKACGQYINSQIAFLDALKVQASMEQAGLIPRDQAGNPKVSYEAILLDQRGYVSEGPGENLFIVQDGILHTPSIEASILRGITRESVIEIARDLGYDARERDIMRSELYTAAEVFMTGTAVEIKPVVEIDHRKIGDGKPGPITKRLQKKFSGITHGRDTKYRKWVSYI